MPGIDEDARELGARILERNAVPGPPAGPWRRDTAYPLAFDVDGRLGAVSFAVLDMYPDIAAGWWCWATTWEHDGVGWRGPGLESDNTTSPHPFVRPAEPTNGNLGWSDWHSNGGAGEWPEEDEFPWRHTFFGIAPVSTARLTVTGETGRERDLRITPWNGAYVAVVAGVHSTLTGYGHDGRALGSLMPMDGINVVPDEPPAGWERVEGFGNAVSEAEVWRRKD
jgi:hypothetical protein